MSVPDDQVTTEIDATKYLDAKLAAMRAHETQITIDGEFYALSNGHGLADALGTEYYTLLAGGGAVGGRSRSSAICSRTEPDSVACSIMGTPQGMPEARTAGADGRRLPGAVRARGAARVLIGSFQYSRGPVPLVAIVLDLAIFVTCLLGGWGLRIFLGGIIPAIGWFIASFVLVDARLPRAA